MNAVREMWGSVKAAFAGYPEWLIEGGAGLFVGLVFGFLARLMGRYALIVTVVLAITLFVLNYFGVITFNTIPLAHLLGLSDFPSLQTFGADIFVWLKAHIIAWIMIIFGFMLGWKIAG
ncbi:MAG: hypothetical protein JW725_02000 [Candidatus Babeliaceae bacterium]|nr:hypothetical protein [Candidatus Babeliaceae bacterium]